MRKILLTLVMTVIAISSAYGNDTNEVSATDRKRIEAKIEKLPTMEYPAMSRSKVDWLIDNESYKAGISAGKDGKSIVVSNGLVARVFRIFPNLATIDIVNQMTDESMLRAVSCEGELVIDGKRWSIGGLDGQPERGYLNPPSLRVCNAKD
jgi:hypothetical protein